jgi:phosphatidylcholine synthase
MLPIRVTAPAASRPSMTRLLLAWSVHALTASGAVLGAVALIDIAAGRFERAAILMLITLSIDSIDGTLARAVGVSTVVPSIDGRRLDDVVDFFNYAIVPAVFMVGCGALPHWGWTALPILASCYGFSQRDAKTEDDFFLGWPSYWNVVALELWLLGAPPVWSVAIVCLFAALVIIPLKYIYPSRAPRFRHVTSLGGLGWILLIAWAVADPDRTRALRLAQIALLYPVYYVAMSMWLGDWFGRASRSRPHSIDRSRSA